MLLQRMSAEYQTISLKANGGCPDRGGRVVYHSQHTCVDATFGVSGLSVSSIQPLGAQ